MSDAPTVFDSESPFGSRTDAELVALAQGGEMQAFDELLNRYKTKVYGTIYHMTGNHEDSNDLLLEVFEKAYFSLEKFKGKSSFSTWIFQITKNHVINHCQKNRNQNTFSLNEITSEDSDNDKFREFISPESTDRDVKIKELQNKLNESLMKLSEEHRLVVVMHDVEGKSGVEIAQILRCSEGTVRSRLHYARQQLQTHLKDYLI
ncbi:MAG: sigma-70 family RNA polymerase sigma factor [Verrucomicrobiae bacterium]|nr:sigma-70 family RNA polymerase sigma factor [Verrucomicrobiae bacterium]